MPRRSHLLALCVPLLALASARAQDQGNAPLPNGVSAVWDLEKAFRESTPTQERVCLNGLWLWQPAKPEKEETPPTTAWGWFKVPGPWPGGTSWIMANSQTLYPHPSWQDKFWGTNSAWYQRDFFVPKEWAGRRITLSAEYLNSFASVFVDGKRAGKMQFPGGEVDLTPLCQAAGKHVLALRVVAAPLREIAVLFNDTNTENSIKASVERRGLCGDVFLNAAPVAARIDDVKIDTSVRKGEITLDAVLQDLPAEGPYTLRAAITDHGKPVKEFTSAPFKKGDLKNGRFAFSEKWKAEKLWDTNTPQNTYDLQLSLLDSGGKVVDTALPRRFGFREFWIDGRDFYLNGTRIFLSVVPTALAQVATPFASYDTALESFKRLQTAGVNCVYTHNYGCDPGAHLSFTEVLRAADDAGMLVSFTQPHFGQYDWSAPDADQANGYARHAAFYVRAAQNHPAVVMYAMSHNATGYVEDCNPDQIGNGKPAPREQWASNNVKSALRAEAIVHALDPGRIVYHHSSGDLNAIYNINFYPNFAPVQELSDWFEPWAKNGVKPAFPCEYGAPCTWDFSMYRGWFKGKRTFGNAKVPWEFCLAEWKSQFYGDSAFHLEENEKTVLRSETKWLAEGREGWNRWDYPREKPVADFQDVAALYFIDNCRATRTWGLSACNTAWEFETAWLPRDDGKRPRKDLKTDWEHLQRPGFSPDFIELGRTDYAARRWDMSLDRADWTPTALGAAMLRNNQPLLGYIAGKAAHFTSKDHNFTPGESVEKQLIVLNNSRVTVSCECEWSLNLPKPLKGNQKVEVPTGDKQAVPIHIDLGADTPPDIYELSASFKFSNGQTQTGTFALHVLPSPPTLKIAAKIAVFDPSGAAGKWLSAMGVTAESVSATDDLSAYTVLVVGKSALTVEGAAPDITRVRDGLRVVIFEQTSAVLEQRFGFRVEEYGLRKVFRRVGNSPALGDVSNGYLRDWRGEATLLPPRLTYATSGDKFNGSPTVKWAGIDVQRTWRSGCRGSVASVLIEKPACGDFFPLVDGGFSLQYSPLLEYREGKGMVLFCQLDVSGRTESDPAAETVARNILQYAAEWKPAPERTAVYAGDPAGQKHLTAAGFSCAAFAAGKLAPNSVLVVGPGGGKTLAANAAAIGDWLKAGGHVLAIGLDETDANDFLPNKVSMKKGEYIGDDFSPRNIHSPLAGVGPADIHVRDVREIPLITGGANALAGGVLATAENGSVVFSQLVPWKYEYKIPQGTKRTFRRTAFLTTRLLANLGVAATTPLLARFHDPVPAAKPEKRWLTGLYLDTPEEWDDPYRAFGW